MKHLRVIAALTSTTLLPTQYTLADSDLPSDEVLAAQYGLTLSEFNTILFTESPVDFGTPLSNAQSEDLWNDATVFEYGRAVGNLSSIPAPAIENYMPYVACSTQGLTGVKRIESIIAAYNDTPGLSSAPLYVDDAAIYNVLADKTCIATRAPGDSWARVYAYSTANTTTWLHVQPYLPSMKMVENTVDDIQRRLDGEDVGNIVETGDGDAYVLGLELALCPGVANFDGTVVPDDDIASTIRSFLVEDDGDAVRNASFYIANAENVDAKSDRMVFWSEAIDNATKLTGAGGTSNSCLDDILSSDYLDIIVSSSRTTIAFEWSSGRASLISKADELGMSEEDLEACVWYATQGVALHPYVCGVEPKAFVQTNPDTSAASLPPSPGTLLSRRLSAQGALALLSAAFVICCEIL